MKNKWTLAVSFMLAALMLAPGALAVEVGFGGSPGSTITKFSSTSGNAINVQNVLSGVLLASAGDLSGSDAGPLEQYFEWNSWDGKEKAAAYVYLGDSAGYDYAFSGTSGKNSATASLTLSAEGVEGGLIAGGFAYNPKDYAGVVTRGNDADTFNYKNALSATSSKVSATQTFYGTDLVVFDAYTWADRGNIDTEALDEEDILYLKDIYGYIGPGAFGWDYEANQLFSEQTASLHEVSIDAKKPYTATASIASNAASSSQSVTLTGEEYEEDEELGYSAFASSAMIGGYESGKYAYTYLTANGLTNKDKNVVYSASSKSTATQVTASQTADVKEANNIYKSAYAYDYANELYANEYSDVGRYYWQGIVDETGEIVYSQYDSGIVSALSGSDSATVKAGSASVTQKSTISGAYLVRNIWAQKSGDYYSGANTNIFGEIDVDVYDPVNDVEFTNYWARQPAAASTLSGQSTATATLSSATVQSSGKWKATVAKDNTDYDDIQDYYEGLGYNALFADDAESSFAREGYAENPDTSSETDVYKKTIGGTKTYSFTENEKANADDAVSS